MVTSIFLGGLCGHVIWFMAYSNGPGNLGNLSSNKEIQPVLPVTLFFPFLSDFCDQALCNAPSGALTPDVFSISSSDDCSPQQQQLQHPNDFFPFFFVSGFSSSIVSIYPHHRALPITITLHFHSKIHSTYLYAYPTINVNLSGETVHVTDAANVNY